MIKNYPQNVIAFKLKRIYKPAYGTILLYINYITSTHKFNIYLYFEIVIFHF